MKKWYWEKLIYFEGQKRGKSPKRMLHTINTCICNACIYSCLCGSHLATQQEGKGEIRYHFRQAQFLALGGNLVRLMCFLKTINISEKQNIVIKCSTVAYWAGN